MLYVIAYDIGSNRRRTRVMKLLLNYGERVNLSVFECDLTPEQAENLCLKLRALLKRQDHIRIYALCAGCLGRARRLGAPEETHEVTEI